MGGQCQSRDSTAHSAKLATRVVSSSSLTETSNSKLLVCGSRIFRSVNDMSESTPDGLAALAKMRQLRAFSFDGTVEDDTEAAHACLAPIGNMAQIQHLRLGSMRIASESLQCLGELKNLKSLSLEDCYPGFTDVPPLLGNLPLVPHLEALDLTRSIIGDADVRYLAKTPNLKTLGLLYTDVTCTPVSEVGDLFLVFNALRHSKPRIVIDDGSLLARLAWDENCVGGGCCRHARSELAAISEFSMEWSKVGSSI